ncbi:kunitz-type trypsin inhibitor-like 2 protein [Lotus japonicus]|uniref:kunitz-type trypsin inhibitor-like 2 protein n=1 Tax=Lotus japonicus TaxID=34305 RepID=UPI0025905654|nr:kunitz-type trypsin inhibitor-like 2 protein [Lotus japonicus]
MKPAIMLLTLSFLLFAFITTADIPLAFSEDAEQVLDTFGNPLTPGGRYFIMPGIRDSSGGGPRPGICGNQTCPVDVLDYSDPMKSMAVKFTIAADVSTVIIFTGTPLDIAFEKPECAAGSSKWVVVGNDFPGVWVGIGGSEDHPGNEITSGSFKIEKDGFCYKLVFCPTSVPRLPPGVCVDVGVGFLSQKSLERN